MTNTLMKICSSCGVKKPLSAFLQLAGTGGRLYGSICHTCRKTQAEEKKRDKKADADDGTTVQTGRTIDSKSKVESDLKRAEAFEAIEEEYHEERADNEAEQKKHHGEKEIKEKKEESIREKLGQKEKKVDKSDAIKAEAIEKLAEEHQQKTDMSFNQGPIDVGRVAQIRFTQSAIFDSYKKWLGNAAPVITHVEKQALANKQAEKQQANQNDAPKTDFLGKNIEKPENPMTDYVQKTWGPGAKK